MHVFTPRIVIVQFFWFAFLLKLEALARTPASKRTDDEYENGTSMAHPPAVEYRI
jgi:hypothetical protein